VTAGAVGVSFGTVANPAVADMATHIYRSSYEKAPLATTYQGAAFSPVGDWSRRRRLEANSTQGGITSSRYIVNRVIDGDKF
jgi:hypothetical protein